MYIYMAPLEGITGYVYRNAFHKYFGGVDKYFTPFIAPAKGRPLRHRELTDVLPENNQGLSVVPQILTNQTEDYVKTAKFLKGLGYEEVNINLGCPSGTVVSKGKGAGLLYDTQKLDHFLYGVFEADIMKVSVKTRIGRDFPEEFPDIMEIFQKYPLSELIIHPRIRTDFYKNKPNLEMFDLAVTGYRNKGELDKLCYNGDIFSLADYDCIQTRYPQLKQVMLGRGLVGNPFLVQEIKNGQSCEREKTEADTGCYDLQKLLAFHDEVLTEYLALDLGAKNVLFKMKELWVYLGTMFPEDKRQIKKIQKTSDIDTYKLAVRQLLEHPRVL